MRTIREIPWYYYAAAVIVFFAVVLISARLTLAFTSPDVSFDGKLYSPSADNTIYLPVLQKAAPPSAIIIDHNNRDITQIPSMWTEAAKQNVVWSYGSTSHGTQLWAGTDYMSDYVNPPAYNFLEAVDSIPPSQGNPNLPAHGL